MPVMLSGIAVFLLALLFAWASVAKALRPRVWRKALARYRLPGEAFLAAAVPVVEAVVVVLAVTGASRAAAALALALLAGFSLVLLRARATHGNRLPCGCFGSATEHDYRVMLVRNGSLGLLAAAILAAGRDVTLLEELGAPDASDVLPAALALVGVAILLWLAWTLSSLSRGGRS